MKNFILTITMLTSLSNFASSLETKDYRGGYELIRGDERCEERLDISDFTDNELMVDGRLGVLFKFSKINEGVKSKKYDGFKICHKNVMEDNKVINYQSEAISYLQPCLLTKLEKVHTMEIDGETLNTYIYNRICQYERVERWDY